MRASAGSPGGASTGGNFSGARGNFRVLPGVLALRHARALRNVVGPGHLLRGSGADLCRANLSGKVITRAEALGAQD
ncbi:MAG: hypothetical protein QOH40_1041 [Arthrobacter pascens]|nr:hypothetical protein [Arthrobacter pascens]